jgi:hypothetical protein
MTATKGQETMRGSTATATARVLRRLRAAQREAAAAVNGLQGLYLLAIDPRPAEIHRDIVETVDRLETLAIRLEDATDARP